MIPHLTNCLAKFALLRLLSCLIRSNKTFYSEMADREKLLYLPSNKPNSWPFFEQKIRWFGQNFPPNRTEPNLKNVFTEPNRTEFRLPNRTEPCQTIPPNSWPFFEQKIRWFGQNFPPNRTEPNLKNVFTEPNRTEFRLPNRTEPCQIFPV
eukprot:sb/3473472/